jgi:Protein of unknown function (DUF2924)
MAAQVSRRIAKADDPSVAATSDTNLLQQEIAQLRDLDLDGLRPRWRNLFGRAAPLHLPKALLLRIVAYRMQANVYGDLGKGARRTLDRLVRERKGQGGSETAPRPSLADPRSLLTGTLLMREWDGVMHRVVVVDDGFVWNGVTYPSLSKVAYAITGTRWNGPRFFGMRAKRSEPRLEPAACDHAEAEKSP